MSSSLNAEYDHRAMRPEPVFHIAFCVDSRYFRSMGATIASLIANNPDVDFIFHIFTFSVGPDDRRRLSELENKFGVATRIHLVDPALFREFDHFIQSSYYSPSILTRLVVAPLLQGVAKTVLYLDADILCTGSIDELVRMDMSGVIAAVVSDAEKTVARRVARLHLQQPRYFNSGVMYINIDLWIENKITENVIDHIIKKGDQLRFLDQDALNIVLNERARFIDGKWNYLYGLVGDLERGRTQMHPVGDAILIHFAGTVKPWSNWISHSSRELFLKYHAISSWGDMPLDEVPQNYKEMRMHSRFLLRRGKVIDSLRWYFKYMRAKSRL